VSFASYRQINELPCVVKPKNYKVQLLYVQLALKILVAYQDSKSLSAYRRILQRGGHEIITASTGEKCLDIYSDLLNKTREAQVNLRGILPFHAVLIDYDIADRNAFEVAREILSLNPHQRVIIASADLKQTLAKVKYQFDVPVEVIAKPLASKSLIDKIEDSELYFELEKLRINIGLLKKADLSHESLKSLLDTVKKKSKEGNTID
jgi:CheY-like chemotaxis protein